MPETLSFSLQGKVVVVCGGSGLLGRALVSCIAGAGATLIITSRDRKKLEPAAAAECAAGRSVQAEEAELESEASVLALRDRVLGVHGRIDGVVYNAASRPMTGWNADLSQFQSSMTTNATGFLATVRALGDAMASKGGGSIVNIASMYGLVGFNPFLYEGTTMATSPDYFFHKAGMINMSRWMATHYGPKKVRVNVVAPGGIYNPDKPQPAEFLGRFARMTALGRMADAREIAGAVIFLLGDASTYVTGATLSVDGGYTAR